MPHCQNSLSGNSVDSFRLKVSFFCQMFRSKNKKVKNGLKLNVMFTLFMQVLVKNRIFFQITSLSIELRLKLKCSEDQILTIKSDFVSSDHLQVAIKSFSNN